MINWKIRFKNKQFWISLSSALLLIIQILYLLCGFRIDVGEIGNLFLLLIDTIFSLLAIMGICVDPTTKGINDSLRALEYRELR